MKKKDLENLHAKTIDELGALSIQLNTEITKLQMDKMTGGKVKNINEARTKMKDRARVLTIMEEKEKGK